MIKVYPATSELAELPKKKIAVYTEKARRKKIYTTFFADNPPFTYPGSFP